MTLANNYVPVHQLGNGATTQFSASWQMISSTYAVVQLEDAVTGVMTTVLQGPSANQYQIVLTASGFTVTMGTAPTSGQYVNISRNTSLDQTDSYRTSKGFEGEVEEASFDKLTAMVQELSEHFSRNISAPVGDNSTNLVLPIPTLRAGFLLGFDASGNVITVAGSSGGTVISSPMVPVVQAASLAAALALLGGAALAGGNTFAGANTFSSSPTVPTPTPGDNTTKAATSAFVTAAIAAAAPTPQNWTPVVQIGGASTGIIYGTQVGKYFQYGKLIIAEFTIILTNKGALTGNVTISGLPFTAQNSFGLCNISFYSALSSITTAVVAFVQGNSINPCQQTSSAPTNLTNANLNNTSQLIGTCVFIST